MKIETRRLSDIKPYPNNPRKNDNAVDGVAESIKQCGYCAPIIVDENGIILAGHTRLKALKKLGWKEAEVVVRDGLSAEQKKKYRLLDNKTGEIALWDTELLQAELVDINFDGYDFGFDIQDEKVIQEDNFDIEQAMSESAEPIAKLGDLWKLGKHRLLCGDSTSAIDVEALMDGENSKLLFTSPPYSDMREYNGGKNLGVHNLSMFIPAYMNHAAIQVVNLGIQRKNEGIVEYWQEYITTARESGLKLLAWNVWDKLGCGSVGQQSAMIPVRHEFLFVFGVKPAKVNLTWAKKTASIYSNGRQRAVRQADGSMRWSSKGSTNRAFKKMESVLDFPEQEHLESVTKQMSERGKIRSEHPATFPIALPAEYIVAFTDEGESVVEPFGGSGTTMVACEQLGRTCYMMELDPRYCDVIIKRWEALTGQTAKLVKDE